MEKTQNRSKYIQKLASFVNSLKLTDDFIKKLESHNYFQQYAEPLRVGFLKCFNKEYNSLLK